MAPKAAAAKQTQKVDDKTFGLKNKNKSKAVQKYIKQITNSTLGAPKGGQEDVNRKEKAAKEVDNQKKALLASLFNLQTDRKGREYDPVAKKAAKEKEEEAIAAGKKVKDEVKKEIIEGIANSIRLTNVKGVRMSELGGHPIIQSLKTKHADTFKTIQLLLFIKANDKIFWVDDPESNNPTLRMMEDVDGEEGPDERSIEEIIEERRAALGPGGTPVTLESFKVWRASRIAMEEVRAKEARDAIIKKGGKSGGGGVGLSGRDLFTFDASLFVDDEGALGAEEMDDRSEFTNDSDDVKKPAEEDSDSDEEEAKGGAAASSGAAKEGVAINEDLFQDGDVPDDLDDLDDDDDE